MSSIDMYRSTPRQVKSMVMDCLVAGLVPFVQSSPGMGKSSIMRTVAEENGLFMIDHRLSTSAPEDLSGLPRFNENGEAVFAPFAELFPLKGSLLPGQYLVPNESGPGNKIQGSPTHNGWMLFLDEFNSASKAVQAASYKLILDRMTGQKKLHERVVITAAGNLSTDRAITNPISTAMQSRVVHIEMEVNFNEWLEDVAFKENYDSRIIAYLSQYPSKLMDFDPKHQDKTFCCPRTWEFMNRLIKGREVTTDKVGLYAGTITSGTAASFVQFVKLYNNLVKLADILSNPEQCPIPQDASTMWATITHMMEKVDATNIEKLSTYADRYPVTFRILFYRSIMNRNNELRGHAAVARALSNLTQYLHG